MVNTNSITLIGTLQEDFSFHHEQHNEEFLSSKISIKRHSGVEDILILLVPKDKLAILDLHKNDRVYVEGQIRTYNKHIGEHSSLSMYVFVLDIVKEPEKSDLNEFEMQGFICKKPIFRTTRNGRDITNLLIAVNRDFHKTSYIPCIAWGIYARKSSNYLVGTSVICSGRMQSRAYIKCDENGTEIQNTTYELSLNSIIPE